MWYDDEIAEHLSAIAISQKLQIQPQSIGVMTENEAFVQTARIAASVVSEIEAETARKMEESVRNG